MSPTDDFAPSPRRPAPESGAELSRRTFLNRAALGSVAASGLLGACAAGRGGSSAASAARAQDAASAARVVGANNTVRVGVIGLNGRGGALTGGFRKLAGVRIAALCDVDRAVLDRRMTEARKAGDDPQGFGDPRQLLESGAVDAVVVATPNHWHSLLGVWAAQHGLHAYVEKPVSHDVWEGAQLAATGARHGVVVAGGTQSRSNPGMQAAIAYVQGGALGRVKLARGLCYKPRRSIGKVAAPKAPPATVDYDLWLGPAPQQPVRREQFHYDWHWQWDFGNGDLGNQGVHQVDLCRWGLGAAGLPPVSFSVGGRVGYDDDGQTPNTQILYLGYEPAPMIFEVRGLPTKQGDKQMDRFLGAGIGCVFHCERGYVVLDSYHGGYACTPDGERIAEFKGGGDHGQNFIDAVRAGDPGLLAADANEGHLSAALCHLGNASLRRGKAIPRGELAGRLEWLPEMSEAFGRMQDHLERNALPATTPLFLGELLAADDAQAWRPRQYREGFVLEPQA